MSAMRRSRLRTPASRVYPVRSFCTVASTTAGLLAIMYSAAWRWIFSMVRTRSGFLATVSSCVPRIMLRPPIGVE